MTNYLRFHRAIFARPRAVWKGLISRRIGRIFLALVPAGTVLFSGAALVTSPAESQDEIFQVPSGFVVEKVAGPPLIENPLFMCFDDRGRLFVAEGTGENVSGPEVYPLKLGKIRRLEDTDGDGIYDTGKTFADGLVLPQGVLWHSGVVYVASHPYIWRLEDKDGDGVAEKREPLIGKFAFNGNGNDIKGPFAGPDGWLYWTHGRHGYKINTREGEYLEGMASRVWRSRMDGSRIERIAGGGFDNPVELTWTAEGGDLIGTMDQWEGDALLHYVWGGVYPQGKHPAVGEFSMTGRLLGQVTQFSPAFPAALCGLVRLRTDYFGPAFKGSLISTHYNVKRLQQHVLEREDSTYRSINKNFLVSTDVDFHPTDVLEDADGSLLVLDMGAWFTYGCPTAGINPKPESRGVIYRVRRKDQRPVQDPWGKSLQLSGMNLRDLADLLGDSRPSVRDRAVEELVARGEASVADLSATLKKDGWRAKPAVSVELRRQALWALSRIGTPQARAAVREALSDAEETIRQIAAHCVALERDTEAVSALMKLVVDDRSPVRLKAAEALGRIGRSEAIGAILESLGREVRDPFLEHALIFALIEIADPRETQRAILDVNPRVRRAGLIALDQMKSAPDPARQVASLTAQAASPPVNYETENFLDGERVKITSFKHIGGRSLSWEIVAPLLDTEDPDLRQAAVDVIHRREGWLDKVLALPARLVKDGKLTAVQTQSLTGVILAYHERNEVQKAVSEALTASGTSPEIKSLLLQAIARVRLEPFPPTWVDALKAVLQTGNVRLQNEAVQVIRSRRLSDFDPQLEALSRESKLPVDLRIAALHASAARISGLPSEGFELLTLHLGEDADPVLRIRAAETLGSSKLTSQQLIQLATYIAKSDSVIVPLLTPAYVNGREGGVGTALVTALLRSEGTNILTTELLERLLKDFPDEVKGAAAPLYGHRAAVYRPERTYLTQFMTRLQVSEGNVERGERVFFSPQAACSSCHMIEGKGGTVGPELSKLRSRRGVRGVLEKIVFPDNTIVPAYRAYAVTTAEGKTVTGVIARESSDAIFLRTSELSEIRIERNDIKSIKASKTSVMPGDLEKTIPPEKLNDLLEYLLAH